MSEKKQRTAKFYRSRASAFRGIGYSLIGLTTLGGFFVYQSIINWENFKNELENFVVVNQTKLNLVIALPIVIGLVIFFFITLKRNKEFFKDKISLSLIITLVFLYAVYCIIEVTMCSLAGAVVGCVLDETIFSKLAKKDRERASDEKEFDDEYTKEMRRIEARKKAQQSIEGSV